MLVMAAPMALTSSHCVRSALTAVPSAHGSHAIPNVLFALPVQFAQLVRALPGIVPGPHATHCIWSALATLPCSVHGEHGSDPMLTLPAAQRLH
jgi:hypothetical protein